MSQAPAAEGRRGAVTICVMLATVMQAIDITIANVALPFMQGELSATLDQINWVLTSYIVAAAVMTPPTGWLAARFGRKRLFIATVAGFIMASMLCGLAASLTQMVVFRLLQGVFGAPLVPLSQAVLLDIYPRERHGQAMAIWGVGVMVGPILGPTLGGYLTDAYNWRWVFFINLPVGILALLGLSVFLSETRRDATLRFDWFGFATLSLAIGAFQMMLDRGEQLDWFGATEIVVEAVLAGTAFYMFVVHMLTAERPFLAPRLFADRNFVTGLVFIFLVGIILLATLALLTPYLQGLMGYPVLDAGLLLAPRGFGTMVAMFLVGRLIGRIDVRVLLAIGFSLMTWALSEMAGFTPDVARADILRSGFVQGLGLGFVFVPLSTITFSTLAPTLRTQATALFSLVRNIGSSIGVSLVIFFLQHNTQVAHSNLAAGLTPFGDAARALDRLDAWSLSTAAGRMTFNAEITRQAAVIAYADDFTMLMAVTIAAMPMILLLRRPPRPARPPVD